MSPQDKGYSISRVDAEQALARHLDSLSDQGPSTHGLHNHAIREFLSSACGTGTHQRSGVIINESQIRMALNEALNSLPIVG